MHAVPPLQPASGALPRRTGREHRAWLALPVGMIVGAEDCRVSSAGCMGRGWHGSGGLELDAAVVGVVGVGAVEGVGLALAPGLEPVGGDAELSGEIVA